MLIIMPWLSLSGYQAQANGYWITQILRTGAQISIQKSSGCMVHVSELPRQDKLEH